MMGCNTSSKIHFRQSHFNFFPTYLGDDSTKHGEKFSHNISTRYIQEEIKWKEIWNTVNVNVYFPFLFHGVILNKSGYNFILVYFSFHIFNIILNKSKETLTTAVSISAM